MAGTAASKNGNRLSMQIKTPPPAARVVKHEDKMETLRTFILAALLTPRAGDVSGDASGVVTLVARSAESPVAKALVSLSPELASRNLTVRAIFCQLEPEKTAAGWSIAGPDIAFARDLRWAGNPRLADAHEQMVLGPATCWTGDCMRRDPARRDAYESYVTADVCTAHTLRVSFERLWTASTPLVIRTPQGTATPTRPVNPVDDDTLAALVARDDASGPLVSSSH